MKYEDRSYEFLARYADGTTRVLDIRVIEPGGIQAAQDAATRIAEEDGPLASTPMLLAIIDRSLPIPLVKLA